MKLHTLIQGQGFPILCIHGHPGSAACMSVFTDRLSQRYQTLAPDLRGYGHSRTAQSFAMADHLSDLEDLLDRHQIQQCLILGWSLGGILALELALRHPQRVTGLILIATAAQPRGNHPPISWQDNVYTGMVAIVNGLFPAWQWSIDTFGRRSLYRHLLQNHTPQTYHYMARQALPAYLRTSSSARRALAKALRSPYDRLADLGKITCPALVLAGENDVHITVTSSRATAEALPNSSWRCYDKVAHLFPWDIPDPVLDDIEVWLQQSNNVGNLL